MAAVLGLMVVSPEDARRVTPTLAAASVCGLPALLMGARA